ncbi:MAG: helix-turn-helix domain-containing protein [Acidimicrobiales bacterium]
MSDLPPFFTVEEAAEVVRIGRTLAYQLAARFEATNGADGLPVVRIGRLLRVPRAALEAWAGAELTATTPTAAVPCAPEPPPPAAPTTVPSTPATLEPAAPHARARPRRPSELPRLPFVS